MPQLVSSDGEIFELSELAAQQSVTLVNIRADAGDDAPIPVPLLDKSALTKITALLERTAAMTLHSAGGGGTELADMTPSRSNQIECDECDRLPTAVRRAKLSTVNNKKQIFTTRKAIA